MIYSHSMNRAARHYSKRPALSVGEARLTFGELHDRVMGRAGALARLGFNTGDRLALLLPNGHDYVELVYACSRLGVIAVPINARLSVVEIDHVLADAGPRGLIRHSSLPVPTVQVSWELVVDEEPLDGSTDAVPPPFYDPEAILALIYTSGTTGRPKGVMLTHSSVLSDVHNFNYWMGHREGGVYLHAAPIFHIADFPAIFAAPVVGACQIALPRFSPAAFCDAVESQRITHTVLVPTMINLLTQSAGARQRDLSSLEVLAYGGSPMAPELIRRTRELLPRVKLVQVYGLSETGYLTGLQDQEHTDGRLTSCGREGLGVELQVADDAGTELGAGQRGELVARGENVYCGEVEAVIVAHPAVLEVAVFGIPDPKWGELVAAWVVAKPGTTITAEELIGHCRERLANYKVPRHFEFPETELPKNGSGKVLKRLLRERFWAGAKRSVG